jgi:hypothetical protein
MKCNSTLNGTVKRRRRERKKVNRTGLRERKEMEEMGVTQHQWEDLWLRTTLKGETYTHQARTK